MNERNMKPEEMEELLGAYALDAVDDDERRAVEEYLATNPRARAEVEQHREVATMLAFSGTAAPDGLWDRIAGALDERAPEPGPELAKVLPMASRPPSGRAVVARRPKPIVAGRAGCGGGAGRRPPRVRGDRPQRQQQAGQRPAQRSCSGRRWPTPPAASSTCSSTDGSTSAKVVVEPDGTAFLAAKTLPELPDDRTYQLWGVTRRRAHHLARGAGQPAGDRDVLGQRPGRRARPSPTRRAAAWCSRRTPPRCRAG